MPLSLRIPEKKRRMIKKMAAQAGKTQTRLILEVIDEKLGLDETREQTVRKLAGWLSHEEANELREALQIFEKVDKRDWD
jgi:uncharacterized protein (DUF1778 family)